MIRVFLAFVSDGNNSKYEDLKFSPDYFSLVEVYRCVIVVRRFYSPFHIPSEKIKTEISNRIFSIMYYCLFTLLKESKISYIYKLPNGRGYNRIMHLLTPTMSLIRILYFAAQCRYHLFYAIKLSSDVCLQLQILAIWRHLYMGRSGIFTQVSIIQG